MKFLQILLTIGLLTNVAAITAPAQQRAANAQGLYMEGRAAFNKGDVTTAEKKFLDALAIDPKHAPSIAMLDRVRASIPRVNAQEQAYSQLIMDEVKFEDATIDSVLEYLRQQAVKKTGGSLQPNFVTKADNPDAFRERRVSLQLANVPWLEVLRYACRLANAEFAMEEYAIVVSPLQEVGGSTPVSASAPATPAVPVPVQSSASEADS